MCNKMYILRLYLYYSVISLIWQQLSSCQWFHYFYILLLGNLAVDLVDQARSFNIWLWIMLQLWSMMYSFKVYLVWQRIAIPLVFTLVFAISWFRCFTLVITMQLLYIKCVYLLIVAWFIWDGFFYDGNLV